MSVCLFVCLSDNIFILFYEIKLYSLLCVFVCVSVTNLMPIDFLLLINSLND